MRAGSALVPAFPAGRRQEIGRAGMRPGGPETGPARGHGLGQPVRRRRPSDRDQPHRRHGPVRRAAGQAEISRTAGAGPARLEVGPLVRQDIDRTAQTRARPGCKTVGRIRLEIGRGIQVRLGRAARGCTGKPHHGRAAWGRAARGRAGPEKGRGPSTHEMEGPTRSRSAGHRYLMLMVRATRSTTKPDTRSKSQLPSSSCVPGCPPDSFRFRQ